MNVLLIPAAQMPPDIAGSQVDARGFIAEVVEATTELLILKVRQDHAGETIALKWVAAGVYRWQEQGQEYAVFGHFNPAQGDIT